MSIVSSPSAPTTPAQAGDYSTVAERLRYRLSDYADLCRPRIAVMTMVSVAVGFTMGSPIVFDGGQLLIAMLGVVQLVAASSMLNQTLEQR